MCFTFLPRKLLSASYIHSDSEYCTQQEINNIWIGPKTIARIIAMDSTDPSTTEEPTGEGRRCNLWVSSDETNGESFASAEESSGLLNKNEPSSSSHNASNQKRSGGLLKKSGRKFVAAIKSLQCSPRVDANGKEKRKKANNAKNSKNSVSPERAEEQSDDPQPIFVANFEEFQPHNDPSPTVENGTASSDLPPKPPQHQNDPPDVSSSAFPLSDWEEPKSPTGSLIQNQLSLYSNESNDTPLTCNRSLVSTPKNERTEETAETSAENDLYAKPPKELFHHSLSLGDSLTPTDDNSPGQMNSKDASRGEDLRNRITSNSGKSHRPPRDELNALNLPIMDSTRRRRIETPGLNHNQDTKNVLRRVQQFEQVVSPSSVKQQHSVTTKRTTPSPSPPPEDDESPISSTVSSFVYSTVNLEPPKASHRISASPRFFWKTHPKPVQEEEKVSPDPLPKSPEIFSPAFFWKTHPRVTTKSYNFQPRKSIDRDIIHSRLRQIAEVVVA